ncbi:MAG: hypothetical protein CMP23_09090 [Rickettsiales bacterium]|nr:hypothetical protein [Rickettsiales bacterium]|tara:strand:+ start:3989 stop:6340 length:2352 start_codon:yes stop_codon:yes gene_type:complete
MNRNLLSMLILLIGSSPFILTNPGYAQSERRDAEDEDDDELMERARREKRNPLQLYYKASRKGTLDFEAARKLDAMELDLPYAKAKLDGGWIVPIKPKQLKEAELEGLEIPERKQIAAVYIGAGTFHWESPNSTERWMLNEGLRNVHPTRKKSDVSSLDAIISKGAILYFNGSWRETFSGADASVEIDKKSIKTAKKLWKSRKKVFFSPFSRIQTQDAFAGTERNGLLIDMATKSIKGAAFLSYGIDPVDPEPVTLNIVRPYALNRDSLDFFDLGQWVLPETDAKLKPTEIALDRLNGDIDIEHYNLDLTVYRDQDLGLYGVRMKGTTDFTVREDNVRMVRFSLINKFSENGQSYKVKSLTDGNGDRLDYLHSGNVLMVRLPGEPQKGDRFQLDIVTEGAVVNGIKQPPPSTSLTDQQSLGNVVKLVNYRLPVQGWFPGSENMSDYFTFDWKLKLPKPFVAATSGTLLSMTEEGKYNVHVIKEQVPVIFPVILFGRFAITENDADVAAGETKIRIYTHPGQGKDAESFIAEADGILKYYAHLFGRPYPYQELDLAQMPVGMGYAQAPSGLVQMTGEVYISKTDLVNIYGVSDPQLRDYFIPHELAHEWWGAMTGFSTRDQWVSETFAEFSAALYVEFRDQQKNGDPNDTSGYENRMEEWKIRRNGHKQDRTAPLWVGYRAGQAKTQSSIYARGPLLMDMLRKNFGRENVIKAMRYYINFAQDHRGGFALTEDWQNMLEQAIPGVGFRDFLQEYIKGNAALDPTGKVTIIEGAAEKIEEHGHKH